MHHFVVLYLVKPFIFIRKLIQIQFLCFTKINIPVFLQGLPYFRIPLESGRVGVNPLDIQSLQLHVTHL